ncbi:MAG: hypothetical protein BWK76_07105 [Desulfobulbaceae bacterium A2]|nr:MAG: hypothetical protein BWK76_07105 [Desulfobulbaceae bacterium A2]
MSALTSLKLADFMNRQLLEVAPDCTLGEASRQMALERVSSILVTDTARKPLGILTERDLVRLLHAETPGTTPMREVMHQPVLTGPAELDFVAATVLMRQYGVRHLVVVDRQDRLIGLVSETDFRLRVGQELFDRLDTLVRVMDASLPLLPPETTVDEGLRCMVEMRASYVLVARERQPLGILTERDMAGLFAENGRARHRLLADVMQGPVRSVRHDMGVSEAARLMFASGLRHLAVLDDSDRVIGMLTQHRLLEQLGLEITGDILGRHQELKGEKVLAEERLHLALEASGVGFWEYDAGRDHITWSDTLARLLGLQEHVMPRTLGRALALVHPADRPQLREAIRTAALPEQELPPVEFRMRCRDGSWRWVMEHGRIIRRDAAGVAQQIIGVLQDITSRKHAEILLRAQRDLAASLPDARNRQDVLLAILNSALCLSELDTGGILLPQAGGGLTLAVSQGMSEQLRAELATIASTEHPLSSLIQARESQCSCPSPCAWNMMADQAPHALLRADGWQVFASVPLLSEDRPLAYLLLGSRHVATLSTSTTATLDILRQSYVEALQRQMAQGAARRQGQLLSTVLESTVDGLLVIGHSGRLMTCNRRFQEMWRLSGDLIAAGDEARLLESVQGQLADPRAFMAEVRRLYDSTELSHDFLHFQDGRVFERFSRPLVLEQETARLWSFHDITEVHRAQARLEDEHNQLRTLVQTIPDLVWLKDPEGVFLSCNPRFELLYGAPEADIIGKTDYDFVEREQADFFRENDRRAIAVGGPSRNEEWLTFASDGYRGLFETIKTPMRDTAGRLIGVLGIARDISAARQAQRALRESEAKLRTLIEAMPDTVQFKDPEGRWLECNHSARVTFGLDELEWQGKSDAELAWITAPTYRPALLECQRTDVMAWASGAMNRLEEVVPQPDGDRVFDVIKLPVFTDEGEPQGLVILGRDITERREAEQRLTLVNFALNHVKEAAYMADESGRLHYVNDEACRALGYSREKLLSMGVADVDNEMQPEDWPATWAEIRDAGSLQFESQHRTRRGRVFPVELRVSYFEYQGHPYVLGLARDISKRKKAEERQRLAASVFASTHEGIVITDAEATIVEVNEAFSRITGYSRDEALGRNPSMLKSGHHGCEFYQAMWQSLARDGFWRGEVWDRRKDGMVFAELLTISVVRDERGAVTHYVGVIADITLLKEHEQHLQQIAHYDVLTGVPNRALLADRLSQAIAQTRRTGNLMMVCFLDLDGFKEINDTYGHEIGDFLLVEVARRLKGCLRAEDTVVRMGGDEFVLLLLGLEREEECEAALGRILEAIARPADIAGHVLAVTGSLGVTLFPRDDAEAEILIRHADHAMYQAKQSGRNRFQLYDPAENGKGRLA